MSHPSRPRLLRAPYHACAVASIAVSSAYVLEDGLDARHLALFAGGVALLVAGLGMRVHDVSRSSGGASKSMYAAVALMLLYFQGPWLAVLSAVVASVAYDLHRRRGMARLVGNLPTRTVPIMTGGVAWLWLGGGMGAMSLPGDYVPLLASAVAFAAANEFCFLWDAMSAADLARARWRDELDRLPANLGTTMLECLVGAGVATICLENPWTAPVVVPLALSMFLAVERGNRIQQVTDSALDTFATIVDERDRYTFEHSDRVCDYSMRIGRRLGLTERQLEALYWTSRLHDLGKVAVDNAILNKPGRLTDQEYEVMKVHPVVSARILSSFSFDEHDTNVVLYHHERFDGGGYLHRPAELVPLEAFIIAVADAFDAMTSDRPYRRALPIDVALEEIARGLGTQFHPEPARAFLEELGVDVEELVARITEQDRLATEGHPGRRPPVDPGDDVRHVA